MVCYSQDSRFDQSVIRRCRCCVSEDCAAVVSSAMPRSAGEGCVVSKLVVRCRRYFGDATADRRGVCRRMFHRISASRYRSATIERSVASRCRSSVIERDSVMPSYGRRRKCGSDVCSCSGLGSCSGAVSHEADPIIICLPVVFAVQQVQPSLRREPLPLRSVFAVGEVCRELPSF